MKRKTIVGASCGLVGALVPLCAWAQNKEWKGNPNVIYILADDLGYGDITPNGQKLIKTPHLERMASEGLTFTQCYTGTAVSAPSRASLMTGMHTGHTFIRGNKGVDPEGQVAMPEGTYTIAQLFKESNYQTGCFGKWGLGFPGSVSDPTKVGFDQFFGYNCQTLAHDYYPDHLWKNGNRVEFTENYNQEEKTYSADLIHQKALEFIKENAKKPFFAYLSYTLPHAELVLPKDSVYDSYCKLIPADEDKPWAPGNPNKKGAYGAAERPLAAFASMVTRLDAYVGDVMKLLNELGIADNTIVIFATDNGPHREGGANPDYFDSYGPFKGIKRDLYEGGIRTPFIVRCPGHIKAGATSNHVMAFWDVMPTLAELLNSKKSIQTDGISFLPSLLGKNNQKEHDYLYWELHEFGGKQAMRCGNWKAVKLDVDDPQKTHIELYDLSKDIHEDNNVAAQHPDIAKKMEQMMKKVRTDSELFSFGKK